MFGKLCSFSALYSMWIVCKCDDYFSSTISDCSSDYLILRYSDGLTFHLYFDMHQLYLKSSLEQENLVCYHSDSSCPSTATMKLVSEPYLRYCWVVSMLYLVFYFHCFPGLGPWGYLHPSLHMKNIQKLKELLARQDVIIVWRSSINPFSHWRIFHVNLMTKVYWPGPHFLWNLAVQCRMNWLHVC